MNNTVVKTKKLQVLRGNRDIGNVLAEAANILGNPILAHNMEYKIIAMTENTVDDDPIWNEFAATGTFSREMLEFFKDERFFDTAANAKKTTYLPSNQLKYNRIFGKLFTKNNIQVGSACLLACYKQLTEEDFELFELTCDILNKLLADSSYYQNYGQQAMEKLLGMLIRNEIEDQLLYTAHVESIYIGLKSNLYVAVADVSQADSGLASPAHFRDIFKSACPAHKYSLYGNYIVMIIGTDDMEFNASKDFRGLLKRFKDANVYVGVSSRFENLFEFGRYYQEALLALQQGLRNGGQNICLYSGAEDISG